MKAIATKSINPVSDGKGLPLIPPSVHSLFSYHLLHFQHLTYETDLFSFNLHLSSDENFTTTKAMEIIQTLNFAIKVNKIENLQFVSIRKIIHVPHQSQ
ncbi:hypothetical protein FXE67_07645 [Vibrio cholerae]|uniref:Uncharacterized protein n=1 Tax=Vibrio cholerae TaxID=666 RepID=A0A8B5ZJG1_VIBCL|nr:hypothetical protein FXE67_07645 [Vibrio cholerae]